MSSYQPLAAKLRAKYGAKATSAAGVTAETCAYAREERTAIAVEDGGMPEAWAIALWAIECAPRPAAISEGDWRSAMDRVWRRADEHGAAFVAHGWTFEEVFGVGEHWGWLDKRGAAWLALDCRIVAIDSTRIVYERGETRSTHLKPQGRTH